MRGAERGFPDGFRRTLTRADQRTLASYTTVLKDRRVVSLSYANLVGSTFHGPVEFHVTNHAGRSEAQGRVELVANTTGAAKSAHVD